MDREENLDKMQKNKLCKINYMYRKEDKMERTTTIAFAIERAIEKRLKQRERESHNYEFASKVSKVSNIIIQQL